MNYCRAVQLGLPTITLCRARIFHGVAAIVKEAPYFPILDHFDPAMSLSESRCTSPCCRQIVPIQVLWCFFTLRRHG
jgi:hypothetical protein